ncbi:MAG: hypothetical protein WBB37_11610 [bacterium]
MWPRKIHSARTIEEALNEISKNKDILYDHDVVTVCLDLFLNKMFKFNSAQQSTSK